MKLNLQLTYADGSTKETTTNTADMVAFEDKFNVSIAALGAETRLSWLLFLAWHAEKRTGATKDSYEKWLDTVENIGGSDQDPK
jgi:hypothetical protein